MSSKKNKLIKNTAANHVVYVRVLKHYFRICTINEIMKYMQRVFIVIMLTFVVVGITSCMKSNCDKFIDEIYSTEVNSKINEIIEHMPKLCDSLNISKIDASKFTKYRLLTFSTLHRTIEILEIEDKIDHQYIRYKKIYRGLNYIENNVEIDTLVEISNREWEVIEGEIYRYEFWTAKEYESRETVDGWGFIIEGNRPIAATCNKRVNHLVFRASPRDDDKMGLMYNQIDSLAQIKIKTF